MVDYSKTPPIPVNNFNNQINDSKTFTITHQPSKVIIGNTSKNPIPVVSIKKG